ncbi:MAG: penicillin-insensitive murein endopeptidase [Gaiellaceae bacterium]
MRTVLVTFAFACAVAAPAGGFVDSGSGRPERMEAAPAPAVEPIAWRESVALGTPSAGRLVHGVRLPAGRAGFFTWDPVQRRRPNREWRRWGTNRLVRIVLRVVREYASAHPGAPRVGIGDLSRPRGGPFGPKHASHQNGLDVDVYYPRLDRRERPPRRVEQIDRRLAQDLVDRFVRAGAEIVYVGPLTGFTGPPGVVQVLWNHDNHLHARFGAKTD